MKKLALLTILMGLVLAMFSGCASMQTSSVYERSAEDKMISIQEKIEDGVKAGALTPDQSQTYLATLKDIRTDYTGLRGKSVSREERNSLQGRLDALGEVIDRALPRTEKNEKTAESIGERFGSWIEWLFLSDKIEKPTRGNRIITLQRRIDDERSSGRISLAEASEFQDRLDYVRSEYLRMMEGSAYEEREVISRLLDSLEADLKQVPQL